jgi:formate dehydrogenase major subunit
MMRVDGREVAARGTLLEACRAAGAEVPALCHDDRLSRGGHCRSCLVEVNGRCVAACTQPAREGLDVRTQSAKLAAYRRDLGELMRAEAEPRREADAALRAWE